MTTASRRIFLYWLLLIIPTLAVGTAAFWLLHREQIHIREQSTAAIAARQAAVQARTRLIAENIGVIMTDVESGLMGTLLGAPTENPGDYLANWRRTNPLVHDVFVATPAGALRWGEPGAPVTAWLATTPWRVSVTQPSIVSPPASQEVSAVSEIAAQKSASMDAVSVSDNRKQNETLDLSEAKPPEAIVSTGNVAQYQNARVAMQAMANYNDNKVTLPSLPPQPQAARKTVAAREEAKDAIEDEGAAAIVPDITGWTPWTDASGALHLFGWRLVPRGAVFVVEVNLAAIASRLREILPRDVAPGESYELFGDVANQFPFVWSLPKYGILAPYSYEQSLGLPGWRVVGFMSAESGTDVNSPGAFLLVSALLVGLFVLAIIGGGSLLLRQARLSAAESAQKTSFVANVSHEFKTPLTTIRLYSELLEQGRIHDEAKRAESLQTISRETQRLARLVNNVLDFSRLEQGRKKFDLAEYDLREEIARILDRHAPRIAEAGLKLDLLRTAAPCVVKTDLDAVEQIVLNLLDNACKYAASGGEVTVTVEKCGTGGLRGTGCQPVGLKVARAASPCR